MGKGYDKKPRKTSGYYGKSNKRSKYMDIDGYTEYFDGMLTVGKLALDTLDEKELVKLGHSVNNFNWKQGTAQRVKLKECADIIRRYESGDTSITTDDYNHAQASYKATAFASIQNEINKTQFLWATDDSYIDWLAYQKGDYYDIKFAEEFQTQCEDILDLLVNGEIDNKEAYAMYKSIGGKWTKKKWKCEK